MSIQESAIAYHDNGFNCAQSVLAALQEETGLDESTAKRVAALSLIHISEPTRH